MTFEYNMLAFMTIFFLLAWIPSSLAKVKTFGAKWAGSNREPKQGQSLSGWGGRVERAHNNLKDNFPGFVVAILALGFLNKFDNTTYWLTLIYVIARVLHFFFYGIGNVPGRFAGYMTALVCNIWLLVKIFN